MLLNFSALWVIKSVSVEYLLNYKLVFSNFSPNRNSIYVFTAHLIIKEKMAHPLQNSDADCTFSTNTKYLGTCRDEEDEP